MVTVLRGCGSPKGRGWLRTCGVVFFAGSAVACGAILGFEDRSLDPALASGADANGDGMGDGAASDGSSDAPLGSVAAPTNVLASKVEAIGDVKTLAGSGVATFQDGQGIAASFKSPYGVVVEPGGNIYVADPGNARIRKVTPNGMVTSLAGSGVEGWLDGVGSAAKFHTPGGLSLDAMGNISVPDYGGNRIRRVTPGGVVTTAAGTGAKSSIDGAIDVATFDSPIATATDASGNIYVAELSGNRIRKVTPTGDVSTLAGSGVAQFADGTGALASFNGPAGVAVTPSGDAIYVSDNGNNRIRKITDLGVVTTLAGSGTPSFGDGKGELALLSAPTGIAFHVISGDLYFGDSGNNRVRRITPDGTVSTLAGQPPDGYTDGKGPIAQFHTIQGVGVSSVGNVFVADYNNHRIRKVTITGIGALEVTWSPPPATGSSIKSYTATAIPVVMGPPTKTCTASVENKCIIGGLRSGAPYRVTVTAHTAGATSPASAESVAAPN